MFHRDDSMTRAVLAADNNDVIGVWAWFQS